MSRRPKTKAGRPADPAFASAGSAALRAWVDEVGTSEAARLVGTSRQTVWSWCVAANRPSGTFQGSLKALAGIDLGAWRVAT